MARIRSVEILWCVIRCALIYLHQEIISRIKEKDHHDIFIDLALLLRYICFNIFLIFNFF